jgi:hypothetical protein
MLYDEKDINAPRERLIALKKDFEFQAFDRDHRIGNVESFSRTNYLSGVYVFIRSN